MTTKPIIIAGPSGSGKSFLVNRLAERYPAQLLLSSITRSPRPGEANMVDGDFLTDAQFDEALEAGDFFLVNELLGRRYAYRRSFVQSIQRDERIPAIIYYTPIVDQIFRVFPEGFGVFLMPKSLGFLADRMRRRGDSEEDIVKRLSSVEEEIAAYHRFANLFAVTIEIGSDEDVSAAIQAIAEHYKWPPIGAD